MNKLYSQILLVCAFVSALSVAAPVPAGVVWFEIPTTNIEKSQAFYKELLGWNFSAKQPGPGVEKFALVLAGDKKEEIGEILQMKKLNKGFGTAIYFAVEDVTVAFEKATKLGGKPVFKPMPIPGEPEQGSIAQIKDLDGNRIGFYSSKVIKP